MLCGEKSTFGKRELNTSVGAVIELLVGFTTQTVWEKRKRAREKRNSSSDVHGIANHSSAETKLVRFRERWYHPISTTEETNVQEREKNKAMKKNRARKK